MAKKQLNTTSITNELEGSAFFTKPAAKPSPVPVETPVASPQALAYEARRDHTIEHARTQASTDASTLAQAQTAEREVVEAIRKVVKRFGKDPLYVRVTEEEKRQIQDITYTYNSQGIDTTDNQLCRIAINYMLEDYQANGKVSILAQVLEALNA